LDDYVEKFGTLLAPLFISSGILIYDYCGEQITEQSALVADSVYQTEDWVDLPSSLKKDLGFVILRAQRPIFLEYWFFRGNLESFTTVSTTVFYNTWRGTANRGGYAKGG
jgi:hypothetical protein